MMDAQQAEDILVRAALDRGDTRVLMYRHQIRADRMVDRLPPMGWAFLRWSRRGGKTRYCVLRAVREALSAPRRIVRYACPTKLHARTTVLPDVDLVCEELPKHLRPRYVQDDATYEFPNGSRIIIGSCETRRDCEMQKGTTAHFAIVEEAGTIPAALLEFVIAGVLAPQFLTSRGRGVIVGTPPEIDLPDHPYWVRYSRCETAGFASTVTLDELRHVDDDVKAEAANVPGGRTNTTFRREYLCERVIESDRRLVPEWGAVAEKCTVHVDVPEFCDWYVSADFGFEDLTVVVFAWYDFAAHKLVVAREIAMQHESGVAVGRAIRDVERELGITKALRVADAPPQLLADLADRVHGPGVSFGPAQKDDSVAALNQLRMHIQGERVLVDPSCTTTISHLAYGVWNERRTDFARADGYGHWDAIPALTYLVRSVNWRRNPVPAGLGVSPVTHQTYASPSRHETIADVVSNAARQRPAPRPLHELFRR